ncbi:hypothetical protein BBJ28_00023118 [Nothophytophthora sp. Chile5]|nr:hypothetical protein BBJ28_00023118 [Nothophytophthora sp. Chile5]
MAVVVKPAPQNRKAANTSPVRGTVRRYHVTKNTSSLPVNVLTLVNFRSITNDAPFTAEVKTRRKQATVLPQDDLPPEASELKRRIWNSHPTPAYKFRLGKMKRMAVPPVEIPPSLADPSALEHMVAGKSIPMTKSMWQQQRYLFKMRRLPSRINEGFFLQNQSLNPTTMAIAKSFFRKPVTVTDAELPKHKGGLALLGLSRHHKSMDVTVETPSSRRSTRKHKRTHMEHQKPLEAMTRNEKQPCVLGCSSVYDHCLEEAMKLKARLHTANSKPATRFRLAVMKRVIVPPVTIPKSLAEHRGSKDFVGGHRVPFTRCMWETEKMRQQLVLRRLYMLSIIGEDRCFEA